MLDGMRLHATHSRVIGLPTNYTPFLLKLKAHNDKEKPTISPALTVSLFLYV